MLYCCAEELRARRAGKAPVMPWNSEILRAVELQVATSEAGSRTACTAAQSEDASISARQAAKILRCTSRYIRHIAVELHGVRVDGRWVFDEGIVRDYYAERQRSNGRPRLVG